MRNGKKIILLGAGEVGAKALCFFGWDNVFCFADTKKATHPGFWCGKLVISFEELCEIQDDYDVFVCMRVQNYIDIQTEPQWAKLRRHQYFYEYMSERKEPFAEKPELTKFKGAYQGKSCFIIGNGPSLKKEDLDLLDKNNVISFGMNAIDKIFPHTKWRPHFYFCQDPGFYIPYYRRLENMEADTVFVGDASYHYTDSYIHFDNQKIFSYPIRFRYFSEESSPEFSHNPAAYTTAGYTVLYSALQWAVYMGFTTIYLLGVDNSNKSAQAANGGYAYAHFYKDTQKQTAGSGLLTTFIEKAYCSAEQYCKAHQIKMYNATRGGNLDVFERISFDSLF